MDISVLEYIESLANCRAFIVGGAVRDYLRGREPHDVDVATDCPTEILRAAGGHSVGNSANFGIYVLKYGGQTYEVARFRKDKNYDGRHCEIEEAGTIEEDLARRDFTINAMALDSHGNIVDPFGGREDLEKGIIRCVGSPYDRFREDYLRILRCLRFAARFGFEIERNTWRACKRWARKVLDLPKERILGEVMKAAESGASMARFVELLKDVGLLGEVFPHLAASIGLEQPPKYHPEGDVYNHILVALRRYRGNSKVVVFAILYHDAGKVLTYDPERLTFHGHDVEGVPYIEELMRALKFPRLYIETCKFASRYHMCAWQMRRSKLAALMRKDREKFRVLIEVMRADRGEVRAAMIELLNEPPRVPITGHDVMRVMGIRPGPKVGQILEMVRDYAAENGIYSREDLLKYLESLE